LLVANQNVLYFVLFEELVVEKQHGAAGVPEHIFDAFFLKAAHNDLSTGDTHRSEELRRKRQRGNVQHYSQPLDGSSKTPH
jgi:hypothetical protein